jgi:hypothetical protein
MLVTDVYRSKNNCYEMPSFVEFLLRENGTHLCSMLACEKNTSHNPIFGVVLHTDPNDAWCSVKMKYQATICYDLRFLPFDAASDQHQDLVAIFEKILQCKVNLLTFSSFERAIALYSSLFEIMLPPELDTTAFCAMFRCDTNNMVDMHLRLVLNHFLCKESATHNSKWRCERHNEWCRFFEKPERLYWFHDYVMCVIDSPCTAPGYSMSNVDKALELLVLSKTGTLTSEELATVNAKQSLLSLLKKAYKYRFT